MAAPTLLPATNVQIPAESILDTFYKQTYLGNAFIVPVEVSLGDTSETLIALIRCPATATKAIFLNLRRFSSSDQEVLIKTYLKPTISTTSTASVPSNLRPASPSVSQAQLYPHGQFTVSSNGTLISGIGCAGDDFVVMDNKLLIILDPGQSLVITATALADTTTLNLDASWYEL